MKKYHEIKSISFTESHMVLDVDGRVFNFKIAEISDRLPSASHDERMRFEISPSGYGIHWPLIDEDLSIDGLLGIVHTPQDQKISA